MKIAEALPQNLGWKLSLMRDKQVGKQALRAKLYTILNTMISEKLVVKL